MAQGNDNFLNKSSASLVNNTNKLFSHIYLNFLSKTKTDTLFSIKRFSVF